MIENLNINPLKESLLKGDYCINCKHFNSYAYIYQDEVEDFETGLCNCKLSRLFKVHVNSDDSCEYFKNNLK